MKKILLLPCLILLMLIPISACKSNADKSLISKSVAVQSAPSVKQVLEEKTSQSTAASTNEESENENNTNATNEDNTESVELKPDPSVDVDITVLSATMVYSEVYQMMYYPENYIGKTIKMDGLYDHYHDDNSGNDYYACIIQDATACCAQGIEFQLSDGNYPADTEDFVTVIGTFKTYEENGTTYCTLADAKLVK
ncbi:hypothetical protein [Butyrivibrio sp. LC3010]|uniref:hypothetical protein n=1 Tax=Butyrivibrio sp. LC3010 TaxID=1280680 RepID=UPI00041AD990|nr:hypothetical protein [Butyrivibrio sp. LC3010]